VAADAWVVAAAADAWVAAAVAVEWVVVAAAAWAVAVVAAWAGNAGLGMSDIRARHAIALLGRDQAHVGVIAVAAGQRIPTPSVH
jgi:hypothetical protein